MILGSRPLKAGNVCRAEAQVNDDSGRVLCEGNPVMEVQSAFFFRGRFTDYENTFETIGKPDHAAELITDADVGALLSKD